MSQAAEDLVLCAMVRSAITAALGLPQDAVPGSHSVTPRPAPPTFYPNPPQPAGAAPQRPLPMSTPQVARAPSIPTSATAQHPGGASGVGGARAAGQQSTGVTSLTALIGQPLPATSQGHTPTASSDAAQAAGAGPGPGVSDGGHTSAVATAPAAIPPATSSHAPTGSVPQALSNSAPVIPALSQGQVGSSPIPPVPPAAAASAGAGATATPSTAAEPPVPTAAHPQQPQL